jgi:hypothetical protein
MTDISACSNKRCPSRTLCYRYTCEKNPRYQSYGAFGRKKGQMRCEDFWDNSKISMCNCEMFAMEHKWNPLCQLKEIVSGRDKEGIKSQKHILKEWDKKIGVPNLKRRKK